MKRSEESRQVTDEDRVIFNYPDVAGRRRGLAFRDGHCLPLPHPQHERRLMDQIGREPGRDARAERRSMSLHDLCPPDFDNVALDSVAGRGVALGAWPVLDRRERPMDAFNGIEVRAHVHERAQLRLRHGARVF